MMFAMVWIHLQKANLSHLTDGARAAEVLCQEYEGHEENSEGNSGTFESTSTTTTNSFQRVLCWIFVLHLFVKAAKRIPRVRSFLYAILDPWRIQFYTVLGTLLDLDVAVALEEFKNRKEEHDEEEDYTLQPSSRRLFGCCPNRRARFWKCAKRRERRRRRQQVVNSAAAAMDPHDDPDATDRTYCNPCCIAAFFRKMHPPLPCMKKRRSADLPDLDDTSCNLDHDDESDTSCNLDHDDESDSSDKACTDDARDPVAIHCMDPDDSSSHVHTSLPSLTLLQATVQTTPTAAVVLPRTSKRIAGSAAARTPLLMDMVRMQQWSNILAQFQNKELSRREAKHRDSDGLYPLHWAVSGGASVPVVQALLDTYPSAVHKADQQGSYPLHFATHYGSKAVSLVLQAHPKAAFALDSYGRSPLFHAIEKQPLDVLMLLVHTAPAMITTPCYSLQERKQRHGSVRSDKLKQPAACRPYPFGSSPTTVLKETDAQIGSSPVLTVTREDSVRTPLFRMWTFVLADRQTRTQHRGKTWDKAIWLLQAAYSHHFNSSVFQTLEASPATNSPHGTVGFNHVLHASIVMDICLPESVVSLLLTAYPQQTQIPNALGQWPLSLAVATPPTPGWATTRAPEIVALLLKHDGVPTNRPCHGATERRSVLHEAIAAGHSWRNSPDAHFPRTNARLDMKGVLHQLILAMPELLEGRDFETGLPPALLAATTSTDTPVTAGNRRDVMALPLAKAPPTTTAMLKLTQPEPDQSLRNLLLSGKCQEKFRSQTELTSHHTISSDDSERLQEQGSLDQTRQLETIFSLLLANPAQF